MEALAFSIAYTAICIFAIFYLSISFLSKYFKKTVWVYGTCNNRKARKNRIYKNVQFILWKKGEHGHKEDFWINFDSSWWDRFIED